MFSNFNAPPLVKGLISRLFAAAILVVLGLLTVAAFAAPELAHAKAKKYEILHIFKKGREGGLTHQGLTLGRDGLYYGSTTKFSPSYFGTLFSSTADGAVTVVHHIDSSLSEGQIVSGELLLGADGNFYGTTLQRGAFNCGTLFQMSPGGAFTVLHAFDATHADPCGVFGKLVQGPDGLLYGTSQLGGTASGGTLFRASVTGEITVLHNFAGGAADGQYPTSSPLLMANGDLYGTSQVGGTKNRGTVWHQSADGAFRLLHSFADNDVAGTFPAQSLCLGRNGQFFGQTGQGAAYNQGAAFRISMKGKVTLLHAWGSTPADGKSPSSAFIQLADGNLYGSTYFGGTHDRGVVFRMTPSGAVNLLHTFAGSTDGRSPGGLLVQGVDGMLRGTTFHGGKHSG